MNLPHPKDWIAHAILIFFICLFFGWKIAAAVGLTIEGTQLEAGLPLNIDSFIDLGADGIGILLTLVLTKVFKK